MLDNDAAPRRDRPKLACQKGPSVAAVRDQLEMSRRLTDPGLLPDVFGARWNTISHPVATTPARFDGGNEHKMLAQRIRKGEIVIFFASQQEDGPDLVAITDQPKVVLRDSLQGTFVRLSRTNNDLCLSQDRIK